MKKQFDQVINEASLEDRSILASVLRTSDNQCSTLTAALRSKSRTILQKLRKVEVSYIETLEKVGSAHEMRRRIWESDRDLERRIVRTISRTTLITLAQEPRREYLARMKDVWHRQVSLTPQAVSTVSVVVAQASGFGVYQMATTVLGMASSAAGITIPFIGYMALTKAIFFVIGPLGWVAIGASALHKLTKPNYEQLVAVVAWMFYVRTVTDPVHSVGDYSLTEIVRKTLKIAIPTTSLIIYLAHIWFTSTTK